MRWFAKACAIATLTFAAPVSAQTAEPECSTNTASLPRELAGWTTRSDIAASAHSRQAAELAVGKAANLALRRTPEVHYALRPEKPGSPESHGGVATFSVTRAGTYRIALGAAAWIDVVRDGAAVTSTSHGHGPACSGVRKMVDFLLKPGRHVLQISGNATPVVAAMIVRLP